MNHGSLFSGIGGFDLAAEWMQWNNVFHCEMNEFGKRILNHYWPNAKSYSDIKQTDFSIHNGNIDILTGGFPCQPYSHAGKRKGKEDERHLWPEMLRAVREIQPRWIVGENVLGLVNWNGGLVFEEVQVDLENEGYEVQPYILPACSINAPHKRDRIWFVAYSNGSNKGNNARTNSGKTEDIRRENTSDVSNELCGSWIPSNTTSAGLERTSREVLQGDFIRSSSSSERNDANSNNEGLQRSEDKREIEGERTLGAKLSGREFRTKWENFPTQPPICTGNDGISSRLDGITFPKWRQESIKGAGNAIVPGVAHEIFKAIQQYENQHA